MWVMWAVCWVEVVGVNWVGEVVCEVCGCGLGCVDVGEGCDMKVVCGLCGYVGVSGGVGLVRRGCM